MAKPLPCVSLPVSDNLLSSRGNEGSTFALPAELRRQAERFFQADLADVRVRVGDLPARLGCGALAQGPLLHFAPGQFNPQTLAGRRAIVHELTHALQGRLGRVPGGPGRGATLLIDPDLEREAEFLADLAGRVEVGPGVAPGGPRPAAGRADGVQVLLPIVTVNAQRTTTFDGVYSKSGAKKASDLWTALSQDNYFTSLHLSTSMQKKVKTKMEHWVNAPKGNLLGGKGHNKAFGSLEDLARALVGRVTDSDSKSLEDKLAKKIKSSSFIRRRIRAYIRTEIDQLHTSMMKINDLKEELQAGGADASRYSFFYSKGISGVVKSAQRSLAEGLAYMKKGTPDISEMCAFVCDYSMLVKDEMPDDAVPLDLPQEDARATHFNVNEQSDWVKRARTARVRLGAGPSATTLNVLRVARWLLGDGDDQDITLLCIALGLFAFWNLEKSKLQRFSEIHTYHEVMLVAHGIGLPTVPALNGNFNLHMAEFDYPQLTDIPA